MVRFSLRSAAFMALSFVAAASPLAQNFGQPAGAAVAAPQAVNHVYGAPAAPAFANEDRHRNVVPFQGAPAPVAGHQQAVAKPPPGKECVMVPCSEEECMSHMTPQEQIEFKSQCEEMRREELKKAPAAGKSRVAKDAGKLTYYKMVSPEEAAALKITDGKTAYISPMAQEGKAVGSRPAGKNL
ncbi:hypothetical protein H4R19_005023, partial [Coemansia spiralis]